MSEFLKLFKKEPVQETPDKKKILILIGIIASAVLLAAGIAFLVYRLVAKRAEEFDEFDEDPDEDLFEEEEG